jgi:hypothetical protein
VNIPRYWAQSKSDPASARGRRLTVGCWRWSDVSVEDAQRQADERGAELNRLFESGTPLDRYGYGDRALREEIVRADVNGVAAGAAVVTRNAYGALVLNSASAMFIDVDFPSSGKTAGGLFRRLLSKPALPGPEEVALQQVQDWADHQRDLGLRVYRTYAGLRCLVTNRTYDPAKPQTMEILRSIGSDPLYISLCQAQACFRARLTPKPWRCGIRVRPPRYPWADEAVESKFRQWQAGYERSIQGYSSILVLLRCMPRFGQSSTCTTVSPANGRNGPWRREWSCAVHSFGRAEPRCGNLLHR